MISIYRRQVQNESLLESSHPSLDLRNGWRSYDDIITSQGGMPAIDLHYMTVSEALPWTQYFLSTIQGHSRVRVITGRGVHSEGGPRLKPAIENYFHDCGISYCERDNGGSFIVYL